MTTMLRMRASHVNRTVLGVDVASVVGLAVLAVVAGYVAIRFPSTTALMIVIPFVVWLIANRFMAALLMAFTLPYVTDVTGGALGLNVALSDVLLTFFLLALVLQWFVTRKAPELSPLSPLKFVVGQYVAMLLILFAAHVGFVELIKTAQRIELFVFPLVVGAALVLMGRELWVLRIYILGAAVTAVLAIAGIELNQKNPTGQFIANGLLLLLASKELRRKLIWLMPLLAAGVLWTQSRGAIVSVGVGLLGIAFTHQGRHRVRSIALTVPLAVASFVAFQLLPEQAQERNLTYTSGNETAAEWAIKIREQYHADAWALIHANPGTGVGVGRYLTGSQYEGTLTQDPHQVLLHQAAEGGYAFAASFLVLIIGTLFVVWKVARTAPLGGAAVAVFAAISAHGLVDVYWVRGSPVLGWLLVGMALAQARVVLRERAVAPPPATAAAGVGT